MKDRGWYNWICPHCGHKNKDYVSKQLSMPMQYTVIWDCHNCNKKSKLTWDLHVDGWWKQRKPPKMKKRIRAKKKLKNEQEKDDATKKDQAYVNTHKR